MVGRIAGCIAGCLLALAPRFAQAADPPSAVDGLGEGVQIQARNTLRVEAYSGNRLLDDQGPLAALSWWSDGRLRTAWGLGVWNGYALATSRPAGAPRARVRELYWRASFGSLDLRAGRLMPRWGRADGWNPSDTLVPRDLRLLTPEMDDQAWGRNGVQADLQLPHDAGRLSLLGLSGRARHRYPLRTGAGVALRDEGSPGRRSWAAKWDFSGPRLDASLSYARGADLTPDLRLAQAGPQGVSLALQNHRNQVLAADFSFQHAGLVWRGEAAWSRPLRTAGADPAAFKRDAGWLVAGPEWNGSAFTVGAQAVWQRVLHYRDPQTILDPAQRAAAWAQASLANQIAPRQQGLTLRLAHRALNDALQSELSVLALWPQGAGRATASPQGLWRGKVAYAIDDQWALQAGLDWAFGPEHSFFGPWSANRLAYLQLRRAL